MAQACGESYRGGGVMADQWEETDQWTVKAAGMWCLPETSYIEMDVRLCRVFAAALKAEHAKGWREATAWCAKIAHEEDDAEYPLNAEEYLDLFKEDPHA